MPITHHTLVMDFVTASPVATILRLAVGTVEIVAVKHAQVGRISAAQTPTCTQPDTTAKTQTTIHCIAHTRESLQLGIQKQKLATVMSLVRSPPLGRRLPQQQL